jgi:PhoPQ-activated pathogenicity-related protein
MKVIDDLSFMEVTEENINQQLVFATYYAKLCKLMLRYNLASTDRSKESVKDVIDALYNMSYSPDGFVSPVSWYETMFFQPKDIISTGIILFSVFVLVVKRGNIVFTGGSIAVILCTLLFWMLPRDFFGKKVLNLYK